MLLVDDEADLRRFLALLLTREGYQIDEAADGEEALARHDPARHRVVISDLKMPGLDGIGLLARLRERQPEVRVIMLTAFSTWQSAVEAMRLGAFGYLAKPFDNDQVKALVRRALLPPGEDAAGQTPVVGHSDVLRRVLADADRIAATDATVLVTGESGTGKELVARRLHHGSPRRDGAFLSINCGALPETLLESELFGHRKGAFTGAIADKPGLFKLADGGTLLLDEAGEMSPTVQVKLLRVLETREVAPVGDPAAVQKVDVRFIAATHRDLAAEAAAGRFREDLYYRLNVIPLRLPPLRERREDIPLLAGHFLARYNARLDRALTGFDERALAGLMAHDWPGNIRELENAIQRAVALAEGEAIALADLPLLGDPDALAGPGGAPASALPPDGLDLEAHLAAIEVSLIEQALDGTDGNVTRAAELLGVSFRQLRYRIKKLGIDRS